MATTTQAVPFSAVSSSVAVKKRHMFRDNIVFVLMLLATLIWLVPLLGALVTALRTNGDIIGNGFWSIPNRLTLDNFVYALAVSRVEPYIGVCLFITNTLRIAMQLH